jgi:hypothetical protein
MMIDTRPKRSPTYLEAEKLLPPELHATFEQLVAEYQFATLKHHGQKLVSPKVIAELILMGWRSPPLPALPKNKNGKSI